MESIQKPESLFMIILFSELDTSETAAKIRAMQTLGVPYEKGFDKIANIDLMQQANRIVENLKSDSIRITPNKEVIAIIAYLQRMGTDISKENK